MEFRDLATVEEFDRCADLQEEVWGDDPRDVVPPAVLMVAQKVGGIAAGAFQGKRMVGFVFGITGMHEGTPLHWSHMLGVPRDARDLGIGRRLKLYQRERLLAMGVTRMSWTFDPLVARNAHLNLNRLGASVVSYGQDFYGPNETSDTDGIIGTDRFVVVWELDRPPLECVFDRGGFRSESLNADWLDDRAVPVRRELPDDPTVYVEVPGDIQALKRQDADEARAWRIESRRCFVHLLDSGYRVGGFGRYDGPRWLYTLERDGS